MMLVTFRPWLRCFPPSPTSLAFSVTKDWVSHHYLHYASQAMFANMFLLSVVSEQTAGGIVVPVSGRLITCLGVDDIVIVDAPDALMVTTRARSQEVKSLVKKCREAGWKNLL